MISVVIPAYKNTDQLITNLKHNIPHLKDCEIIVVNDYPTESIKEKLGQFSSITLIENPKNLGFGETVNVGVNHAKGHYVILLNSDVVVLDGSYRKALVHFEDTNVFAVSFAQKEKTGEIVGKNRILFQKGLIHHERATDTTLGENGWAEGGSCMVDREKFIALGGFDRLYAPFYWEDIDLSYNAWKSGYIVLFDPAILVEHHHESTIGKYFGTSRIKKISYRNQFIFTWKNISDKKYCLLHILYMPVVKLSMLVKWELPFFAGAFLAFLKIPQILTARLKIRRQWKLRDEEILAKFK